MVKLVPAVVLVALGACADARPQPAAPAPPPQASRWTIGIYTGPSIFRLAPPPGAANPVLTPADVTDMAADTVAHPFMTVRDSRYYLFFTVKNQKAKEGGIGLAESPDGLSWTYRRIVLDEPYDLAYPFVFEWRGDHYMIPEAHTETSLRLYRATGFPEKWTYERELLSGDRFISASVVHYQDAWWMFVARPGNATLRLFWAADLKGSWTEHPASPIVEKDPNIARPGGRPVVIGGALYRIAQDCYPTYGNRVLAFQVTEITRTAYREKMIETPLVGATSTGWNAEAMHHVDPHPVGEGRWIAAVDALGK
jgi:hypothetical protein